MSPSKSLKHDSFSHAGELVILQKLDEVGSSVKVQNQFNINSFLLCYTLSLIMVVHVVRLQRVQTLIEEQQCQTSEPMD